jgi:hypothetical protein
MLVMMKHPVHGRMSVYSVFEVEANKASGWVVDDAAPELKAARPAEAELEAPNVAEEEPTEGEV